MTGRVCKRFLVSGRVQGVFFRDSTAREARRLGLTGHALNLSDGRVEVLACGAGSDVERLERWLASGPPLANVAGIEGESVARDGWPDSDAFVTG